MADWWRSWHGAPTDAKWLAIARRAGVSPLLVSGVAWALFDHASQQEDRGSVVGFDPESYAVWAGVDESDVQAVIAAMEAKAIITDNRLTAWERRQPKREDDSAERVRSFRERQKRDTEPVTHRNADVTQRNAPDKRRVDTEESREETDTEPEEKQSESVRALRAVSPETPHGLCLVFLDAMGKTPTDVAPAWFDENRAHTRDMIEQGINADQLRRYIAYEQRRGKSPIRLRYVKKDILDWEAGGEPTGEPLPKHVNGRVDPEARQRANMDKYGRIAERMGLPKVSNQ